MKIIYRGGLTQYLCLEVYSDADWEGDKKTRRSNSAYVTILVSCPISWFSKKQTTIIQSSMKADYIVTLKATKKAV